MLCCNYLTAQKERSEHVRSWLRSAPKDCDNNMSYVPNNTLQCTEPFWVTDSSFQNSFQSEKMVNKPGSVVKKRMEEPVALVAQGEIFIKVSNYISEKLLLFWCCKICVLHLNLENERSNWILLWTAQKPQLSSRVKTFFKVILSQVPVPHPAPRPVWCLPAPLCRGAEISGAPDVAARVCKGEHDFK